MRILPNMKVYVPFTGNDVEDCVRLMLDDLSPNYLRLNLAATLNLDIEPFKPWRKLKSGNKGIIIGTGPVLSNVFALETDVLNDYEVWLVSLFPLTNMPNELIEKIKTVKTIVSMEEHNGQCGLYETLAAQLLANGVGAINYKGLFANGYPSGKYGNQKWHQAENNLEGDNLKNKLVEFLDVK
jgi:transketolase